MLSLSKTDEFLWSVIALRALPGRDSADMLGSCFCVKTREIMPESEHRGG